MFTAVSYQMLFHWCSSMFSKGKHWGFWNRLLDNTTAFGIAPPPPPTPTRSSALVPLGRLTTGLYAQQVKRDNKDEESTLPACHTVHLRRKRDTGKHFAGGCFTERCAWVKLYRSEPLAQDSPPPPPHPPPPPPPPPVQSQPQSHMVTTPRTGWPVPC